MQSQSERQSDSVSHYRLLECLGRGGMGVVYKAVDLRLERTVALKFLPAERGASEEHRRRFLREARAASALDHPNICTLYEIGEAEDGRLFLAMAYVEGETLARRIERGPLPLAQAVDLAGQVAAGLEAAHRQGIVHRDIKPGNLLVTPAGQVKIVDFGIARREDQTLLTHAGMALGTTAYMSPEQLRGEPVDARADLWALGVVLYEMVTAEVPFGRGETAAVVAILRGAPRPLTALRPGIPAGLEAILERALAKERRQRFASAAQMRADLARLAADPGPAAASGLASLEIEETLIEVARPAQRSPAPEPANDELPTGLRLGSMVAHYRVVAPLGSGSMGVVYRALDTRLGRTVALKFLSPERTRDPAAKERFLKEARAASALDHPNLCTVHEVGETAAERLYLAMPCYDGETLAARIARGPLPTPEAVEIAAQAARGLAKAHRGGIVHRDVKPANLLVTADSVVKILDFGLAQLTSEAGAGSLAGTPAYMSPEQTRKEAVGPPTDVWSLGVVLYEMLAGGRPFGGGEGGASAVFHAIRETAPEPLGRRRPDLPAELADLVLRMLRKDPAARPTVSEVQADLDRLRVGLTTGVLTSPARRPALPAAVWIPGALLLALLLGTAAWVALRDRPPRGAPPKTTFARLTTQEGRELEPSISPDGKAFAYTKRVDGRSHLFLQQTGGTDPVDLSAASRWDEGEPAFSPDGRRLAFRSERDGGGIYLRDLLSGAVRRLTGRGHNPAWSPDGRAIVFATEQIQTPNVRLGRSELWRVGLAGGEPQTLVAGDDAVQPSWSPHGRRIAFWGVPTGTGLRAIWTIPARGGERELVVRDAHLNWNPVWSPDGRYLYFVSDRGGSMNLWRVAIDESSGRSQGDLEPITTPASWIGFLSLSRDGRHLLYATDESRSNLERAALDPETAQIAGPAVPVTRGAMAVRSSSPSPDGRFLVFDVSAPQEDLFVVPAAGGEARQLTNDPDKDRLPRWSPDGSRILFYSNRSGSYEAWSIRPDGRGLEQLTAIRTAPASDPLWSPDGRRIALLLVAKGEVIVDLSRPLALRAPEALPPSNFVATSWSREGLLAGQARNLVIYSFASRTYESLGVPGHGFSWLRDGRRLVFLDQGRVRGFDSRTRRTWDIARPAANSTYTHLSVARDDRTLFLVRSVEEGDIGALTMSATRD